MAGRRRRMSNVSWVLVGMLASGAGGALGLWLPEAAGVWGDAGRHRNVSTAAYVLTGATIVAFIGGFLSVGRGGPAGPGGWIFRILVIAAGVPLAPFLFLLIGVVLPAVFGGLVTLAITWAVLARLGVRPGRPGLEGHAASGDRGRPAVP